MPSEYAIVHRRLLPALAGVGIVLGAVGLWSRSAGQPVAVDTAVGSPGLRLSAGSRTVYQVSVQTAVELFGGDGPSAWRHQLVGRLQVQVLGDSAGLRLACRLVDPVQRVDGELCQEPLLGTPFSVQVDRAGRFGAFAFMRKLPEAPRGQLQQLLRLFEVVVPLAAGDSWQDQAETRYGACTVVYRRSASGLTRARIAYRPGRGEARRAEVLASKSEFELAERGAWLRRAAVHEAVRVQGELGHTVRAETTASLVARPGASWIEAAAATAPQTRVDAAPGQPGEVAAGRPIPVPPASPADWQHFRDLLARLNQAERPGGLLDALRDAMLAHPDLCAGIPDLLRGDRYADLTASTLIHAMRLAGHAQAQRGLAALAGDSRQRQANRLRALIDLGGVEAPTAATREHLWAVAAAGLDATSRELATTATLALGRLGRTLRDRRAPDYPQLRQRLRASLTTVVEPAQRTALLTAAGNTGDPELQQSVVDALEVGGPGQRGAAAKALGRIPTSQGYLLRGLSRESNARVRAQLARGLLQQGTLGEAPLRLVAVSLARENDASARYAMARVLGQHLTQHPELVAGALRQLMRTETSARTRAYVAGRLASR